VQKAEAKLHQLTDMTSTKKSVAKAAKVVAERGPKFFSEIGRKGSSKRGKQREGSKDAEDKVSLEDAGRRGGQRKMLNRTSRKHEKE